MHTSRSPFPRVGVNALSETRVVTVNPGGSSPLPCIYVPDIAAAFVPVVLDSTDVFSSFSLSYLTFAESRDFRIAIQFPDHLDANANFFFFLQRPAR